MWPFNYVTELKTEVQAEVKKTVHTQMMLQRELGMAVNIAKARDALQWYGGLYTFLLTGITSAKLTGKALPPTVGIPVVIGGFMLANMADMAYGNKLQRVVKETEHILSEERSRMVPPDQAPFAYMYTEDEKSANNNISAVGALWPPFFPISRPTEQPNKTEN